MRQGPMLVQDNELKFTQLSKYAPYVVTNRRLPKIKFLYGVSHLLKIEWSNVILLGYMDISKLMTYAPNVDWDKLKDFTT